MDWKRDARHQSTIHATIRKPCAECENPDGVERNTCDSARSGKKTTARTPLKVTASSGAPRRRPQRGLHRGGSHHEHITLWSSRCPKQPHAIADCRKLRALKRFRGKNSRLPHEMKPKLSSLQLCVYAPVCKNALETVTAHGRCAACVPLSTPPCIHAPMFAGCHL